MGSISVWMGQGGGGPITASSGILDSLAWWSRIQQMTCKTSSILWGAVGDIGLRRAIYGSRDVFAKFDMGQKLLPAVVCRMVEKIVCTKEDIPEYFTIAYLDETNCRVMARLSSDPLGN